MKKEKKVVDIDKRKKTLRVVSGILACICAVVSLLLIVDMISVEAVYADIEDEQVYILPTIDFVQPWLLQSWYGGDTPDVEGYKTKLDEYFTTLDEAGYDTVIFQYAFEAYGLGNANAYFNTDTSNPKYISGNYGDGSGINVNSDDILEYFFSKASQHNFKIFLGLSVDGEWWNYSNFFNAEWMMTLAERDKAIAQELFDKYYAKYSQTFAGWYWAIEMFTNPIGLYKNWAKMFNSVRDGLDKIDGEANLPVMMSPFHHKIVRGGYATTTAMWSDFFQRANMRANDIFAPQDSIGKISNVGVDHDDIVSTDTFVRACGKAVAKYNAKHQDKKIKLYINCELFATESISQGEGGFATAGLDRVERQLQIVNKMAKLNNFTDVKIVTFSYAHYYFPDSASVNGAVGLHQAYIDRFVKAQ